MSKFSDATLYLAPSGYKEGILFPQKPLSTNGEISFTRASSAWRTNIEGQVEEVCYNLLQQSEDFSNAAWSKTNITVTTNSVPAPDGTLTADTIAKTSTDANIFQSISQIVGNSYTYSVYLRADVGGTIVFGTSSGATFQIINITTSWQRYTFTRVSSTANDGLAIFFTASTLSSIYIWGAQLVQGSLPRPYLSTTNRQNFPRVDYSLGTGTFLLEPQRTNSIRNSTMVGASTSPSTLPTNWIATAPTGWTRDVVGVGVENGLSYVDIRYYGTPTVGSFIGISPENNTQISAISGQTWSYSVYAKKVSGTFPTNTASFQASEYNSSGVFLANSSTTYNLNDLSNLTRLINTRTLNQATCAYTNWFLRIDYTIGVAYDFTIRIAQPQIELGSYSTSPILTSTVAVTRIADSFSRGNIFTNNLISSSGGTWFVDLKNTVGYARDTFAQSLFIGGNSTGVGGDGFAFTFGGTTPNRPLIRKYVSAVESLVYTLASDNTKIAIKWNGTSADIFADGVKVNAATPFSFTNLQFLGGIGSAAPVVIQQMALWRTPLTDAECIAITI